MQPHMFSHQYVFDGAHVGEKADVLKSTRYTSRGDLVWSQAEHGGLSSAILITDSRTLADKVNLSINEQLKKLSRRKIIEESLMNNGMAVIVKTMAEAVELTNLYAPEHVLLLTKKSTAYEKQITNAGCIILGKQATVAMSDYVSGPSHTLPTEGTARFSSPLNVLDFLKITNISGVYDLLGVMRIYTKQPGKPQ